MKNVIKKEYFNQLLKEGKLKFNKDFETTIKGTQYAKEFQKPENLIYKIKRGFGNFLNKQSLLLNTYKYPNELMFLLSKIIEHSPVSNTFIVGGAIRDIILNKEPKDYDIVTDVPYNTLKEIFSDYPKKEVGEHFKVLMLKIDNMQFEIANFRKDIYIAKSGKGADRVEIGTIDDDKQRRDFDVNCLYFNPNTGTLIDGNGTGLKSLFNKEFRFVGNPDDRINEDVLRLLRVAKLKKKGLSPSRSVMQAFRRNFHKLCLYGKPERIREHIEDLLF